MNTIREPRPGPAWGGRSAMRAGAAATRTAAAPGAVSGLQPRILPEPLVATVGVLEVALRPAD
jgi:hypothetical protein